MQKTKDANDSPKIFSNQRKQSRCGWVFDLHFAPKEPSVYRTKHYFLNIGSEGATCKVKIKQRE